MNTYHKAVLVQEIIEYLGPTPSGIYVDATFGGGGHTRAILEAEPTCKVIAFDWDQVALETNGPALKEEFGQRLELIWGNFADIQRLLKKHDISKVEGVLGDFGTSQFQIHERPGFSFVHDTPLDMRMAPAHQRITAYDVINRADEKTLAQIFFEYGEERRSKAIARVILEERAKKPIKTTGQLADLVKRIVRGKAGAIHPATRVFQALRIYVNDELKNISGFLRGASRVLQLHGRLVCISFHSLEDRLVKNYFKEHGEHFKVLTPKVVVAKEEEIKINRSARSAKLRAAELIKLFV